MTITREQELLEAWWNEDPEMRHVEILCGENWRVCVRLMLISYEAECDVVVGEGEAGTLLEAIEQAVSMAARSNAPK